MKKFRDTRNANSKWGNRINQLLQNHNITQSELAKRCDVSPSTISSWIANDGNKTKSVPTMSNFLRLVDIFHVSPNFLVGIDECTTPKNEVIHRLTGLSDKSIKKLKSQKKKKKDMTSYIKRLHTLNYLIENINDTPLLENIYEYLFGDFFVKLPNAKDLQGAIKVVSKHGNSREDGFVITSVIGEAYFSSVQGDLVRLKDKISAEKLQMEKMEYKKWEREHKQEILENLCTVVE